MTESPLKQLLDAYQKSPHLPLPLPDDPDALLETLDQAKVYVLEKQHSGNIDAAKTCVNLVWAIARQSNNPEHKALAHWCQGLFFLNRQIRNALAHLEAAQTYYRQQGQKILEGRVLIGIASQLSLLARLPEAEAAIRQAISALQAQPNYRDWPVVYLNLSQIQGRQGYYAEMLDSARRAEEMSRRFESLYPQKQGLYRLRQGQALVNQARAAAQLGRISFAETALQKAQELAIETKAVALAGRVGLNLARLLSYQGRLVDALHTLHQARIDFAAAKIEMEQASIALEEVTLYRQLNMPYEARQSALRAADAFEKEGIIAESVETRLLAARLSLLLEEPAKAQRYLEQTQPQLDAVSSDLKAMHYGYGAHPLLLRKDLLNNAKVCQKALLQADYAAAALNELGIIAKELEIKLIGAAINALRNPQEALARYRAISAAALKHRLPHLAQTAYVEWGKLLPLPDAAPVLRQAADLAAAARRNMPVEELKAALLGGSMPLYTRLIESYLAKGQTDMALQTLFEAKGSLWAELFSPAKKTDTVTNIPERSELEFWRSEARSTTEAEYQALCQKRIKRLEAILLQKARQQIRRRAQTPLPTPADIQAALPSHTVLLEYLLGEDRLRVCVISGAAPPNWLQLGKSADIKSLAKRLELQMAGLRYVPPQQRQNAAQAQLPLINKTLTALYRHLIAPLEDFLPSPGRLLIAPDRFLYDLPWAALRNAEIYLGEKYPLALLPSATLWRPPIAPVAETNKESPASSLPDAPEKEDAGILLLGYKGDPPLRWLAEELKAIQGIFPRSTLINPARRQDLNRQKLPRYAHLAAHSVLNPQSPLLSGLQLADGHLLLADIFNLQLRGVELLTLSACESAVLPERGGLLLALGGAFLSAGAKAVLASLWPVDDEGTQLLMAAFYASLRQGQSSADALQSARQELRRQGFEHPYYWAAFQLLLREQTPL